MLPRSTPCGTTSQAQHGTRLPPMTARVSAAPRGTRTCLLQFHLSAAARPCRRRPTGTRHRLGRLTAAGTAEVCAVDARVRLIDSTLAHGMTATEAIHAAYHTELKC